MRLKSIGRKLSDEERKEHEWATTMYFQMMIPVIILIIALFLAILNEKPNKNNTQFGANDNILTITWKIIYEQFILARITHKQNQSTQG
ncbi:unnamed protein product [Adineta steineri]|uniref:Uncharacterized protein n=1 Tax=Adineta steineri TaxID=433720 RepID=A0A814RAJ8_9BILA|nr:unnamed protein product [Adineta steineri]CAF1131291.1 unnamed protein product [Adineta steineri]CAF3669515.1 unnamed protein product [Adineta steineri]CAF3775514.1 unnamed protein product [Adineta steineri]